MTSSVELYVYDLSGGMAKQLSRQLVGRQIDGIWHTSVVVFGKEIFYGQGIFITQPDLPTDFLSTPFGAALRPTIDALSRRPPAGATPQVAQGSQAAGTAAPNPQLAASILQSVAAQAQAGPGTASRPPVHHPITGPIHVTTNSASFDAFLKSHKAAVAFFTSQTCPPCRMIEPIFERLADEKGIREDKNGAGFAKVDLGVGMGNRLAGQYGVRATPTFIFFLDGKKVEELRGADANELRTQVDILLFQAYPPHPHTGLKLPIVQALSLDPILFKQVPPFDTMFQRLSTFIDGAQWPESSVQSQTQVKDALSTSVLPYLKSRYPQTPPKELPTATPLILETLSRASSTLAGALAVESLFPVVDIWRLCLLDPSVANWISGSPPLNPIAIFLPKAVSASQSPSKSSRNYILTVLRMLANGFTHPASARWLMLPQAREKLTEVLIPSLLHEDATVRTSAASLAFNAATALQKPRVEAVRAGRKWNVESEGEDVCDWEVEMVSAITEALEREKENEEVVHRLAACIAFLVRMSPSYDSQISPLLQVLQTKDVLKGKLEFVKKPEVRRLVDEVANKLCPT
ncbi:hypothetical protein EST38_g925 [Candolleomyces aberdarensis]|uniref:Thioredoxin domain-containing protein n=1 Tax=Candolleomyces aberdarensis TaxID=2316362 RepID=A0A4Q2DZ92_9AGAR|nr:hypothetical protein EST38_g925 [Candolleomyces aberdarensis]